MSVALFAASGSYSVEHHHSSCDNSSAGKVTMRELVEASSMDMELAETDELMVRVWQ